MTEAAGDGFAAHMIEHGTVDGVDPKWQEASDRLVGTCDSALEFEDLFDDQKFCEWLDTQIFLCTQCGWWCEMSEEESDDHGLDEWTCRDCCNDT